MTNILELLKNEKVEWKKLKDILVSINTGLNPRKNFILNDINGELTSWYITTKDYSLTEKIEFIEGKTARITEEARKIINKRSNLEKGDLLFSAVGTVGKVALVEIEPKNFDVNESTFILKPNKNIIIDKYLLHYLRGSIFQSKLSSKLRGSTLTGIRKGDLENFEIPIPLLETQEKIVEILDKFTNYVTELQSELQSRTKQYTYYRDMLLGEEYLNKVTKEMEEDRRLIYTSLGKIGKFTRGNGLQKKDFQEEGKPVIHYGQIYTKYGFLADKVLTYVNDEIFSKLRKAQKNDILIATTSENVEDVGKSVVWAGEDEIGFSGDMYSYRTEQNSKYIAYYFQTNEFQKQKERKVTGTKMIRIHADDMEKFEIPLPPLSLQNKIVKVLDKFQLLLEDTKGLLPEEIEQRQKQYEYYREKLLTFDIDSDSTHARTIISNLYYDILYKSAELVGVDIKDKVELIKLSEVAREKLSYGSGAKAVNYNDEVRYIRITDINENGQLKNEKVSPENIDDKYILKKGDILFARSGATVGKNYYYNLNEKAIYAGYLIKFAPDYNKVNSKYVYYCVNNSAYEKFILDSKSNASQPNINAQQYSKFEIQIPPLHVQQHIVSILDKFDTLVNDIKEGLPKEIEQRQKQYEYWREQLLSFSK